MKRTRLTLFLVLFVNAVGSVPPTVEARTHLRGPYAFVAFRSCTVSSTPFSNDPSGAPTVISSAGVSHLNAVDAGTITFNADGTGTQTGRSTTLDITTTAVGASILGISEFSVPFTFVVNDDSTVDIKFDEGTLTNVLGTAAGAPGTTGPRSDRFTIVNADTLLSAPKTDIEQETLHINVPHDGSVTQYRLCVRSGHRGKLR